MRPHIQYYQMIDNLWKSASCLRNHKCEAEGECWLWVMMQGRVGKGKLAVKHVIKSEHARTLGFLLVGCRILFVASQMPCKFKTGMRHNIFFLLEARSSQRRYWQDTYPTFWSSVVIRWNWEILDGTTQDGRAVLSLWTGKHLNTVRSPRHPCEPQTGHGVISSRCETQITRFHRSVVLERHPYSVLSPASVFGFIPEFCFLVAGTQFMLQSP